MGDRFSWIKRDSSALLLLVSLILVLQTSQVEVVAQDDCETIAESLENDPKFSTFYEVLQIAESNPGFDFPFTGPLLSNNFMGNPDAAMTVFRPNNDAFNALAARMNISVEKLLEYLASDAFVFGGIPGGQQKYKGFLSSPAQMITYYHVAYPKLGLPKLPDGKKVDTLWVSTCCNPAPAKIPVRLSVAIDRSSDDIIVESLGANSTVLREGRFSPGESACAGIMHELDEVLLPFVLPSSGEKCLSIWEVIQNTPELSYLQQTLGTDIGARISFLGFGDAQGVFENPLSSVTLLAPSNAAFESLAQQRGLSVDALITAISQTIGGFTNLVNYHTVSAAIRAQDFKVGQVLPTILNTYDTGVSPAQFEQRNLRVVEGQNGNTVIKALNSQAKIVDANIEACASVVHIVDRVLQGSIGSDPRTGAQGF